MKLDINKIEKLSKLCRYYILESTTEAGSGHPTSSLSAVELMTTLMFSGLFKYNVNKPKHPNNDRLIFSKGHASPLFYSLWALTRKVSEKELLKYRKFNSILEGHPSVIFPYTEATTGSLGQGLSVGIGIAMNAKLDSLNYKTYVLLGDSEMSEGSVWEAIQLASHYNLNNLIGIIDVNRLGQRGETMYGYDLDAYKNRINSFGWHTITIDGHNIEQIYKAYHEALNSKKPVMIIAKTVKGKGVSFLENQDGWHGRALKKDEFEKALQELGNVDKKVKGKIDKPKKLKPKLIKQGKIKDVYYSLEELLATRKAYGNALVRLFPRYTNIVVLDAEVSNSTFSETFKKIYPYRFFEMFIAEQNMVGCALGLSTRQKIPFISTFAAFLTRAHDQIRMCQYSKANVKFIGSHVGVAIGEDGPSQMGLEDISLFRSLLNSVVLYPCDAVSTEKLVEEAAKYNGIVYIRTTRNDTKVIYNNKENFFIGGSKVLRESNNDKFTIVTAGITVFEALEAYEKLKTEGIFVRVIDLYSIKPLDRNNLIKAANETKVIITVEDHYKEGGIGEAVSSELFNVNAKIYSLYVNKIPKSGTPKELFEYEEISSNAIIKKIRELI